MDVNHASPKIVIVGNPYAPIGRGVVALNFFRAMKEVNLPIHICDISSKLYNNNPIVEKEISENQINQPGDYLNIYVINADEIESSKQFIGDCPSNSYNIIYPAWELSRYPEEWISKFNKFNEVWVPSSFMRDPLINLLDIPVTKISHPVEVKLKSFFDRKYFNLPENTYLFLFFFDFRSYIDRKNPFAFIEAFEYVLSQNNFSDCNVVIKINGAGFSDETKEKFANFIEKINKSVAKNKVILLDFEMNENEVKNLIRCCDCFVSLHRSEGFGLGIAEAMYLGKPVIATNYSGNVDFMNAENSFLVDYKLIPVLEGQYPHFRDQVWADVNIPHAGYFMNKLQENPKYGTEIGDKARLSIKINLSYLSIGLKIKTRILEIMKNQNG